jgi:neutral ceramidase
MDRLMNRRCFGKTAAAAGLSLTLCGAAGPAVFRAGTARKRITPDRSIRMAGYAARTRPSEGVLHDLWVKALAFEDAKGERLAFVAADLVGLPREVCDEVAARAAKTLGLQRRQILFNASHTHSGPVIWPFLRFMTTEEEQKERPQLLDYRSRLIEALVEVLTAAVADLRPATLQLGHGSAGFAANRRQPTEKGYVIGVNPKGPVDHDVPVLKISASDGTPRVVLFGYACHNTTLTGGNYLINGDYAGFAQIEIEKALPGATAMFMQLCGADQNPNPRSSRGLAEQYGKELAEAVRRALDGRLETISPTIRIAYEEVKLDIARQDRAVYEEEAKSKNAFHRRRAETVLAALDAGRPVWQVSLPVHVVRLGGNLSFVALGGEVVVDYALRLKREYPNAGLIVAGYSNDVPCYIPSRRMLKEGGYEPIESMVYYQQAGPFAENVEDTLIDSCRRLLAGVGVKQEKQQN